MLVDWHIARQLRQRIRITRRVYLHPPDLEQQIVACAHADIAALIRDEETIRQLMLFGFDQHMAELLQIGVLIGQQRLRIHEKRAGLAAVKLSPIEACKAFDHRIAIDQPDWNAVVDHRNPLQFGIVDENFVGRIVVQFWRERWYHAQQCQNGGIVPSRTPLVGFGRHLFTA